MDNKREHLLGKEKVSKALLTMSIPSIVGMLVNAIYNIVDTIFVGSLGKEQLGASTIVFPLFMLIGGIGLTFGVGAASYMSRLLGAKQKELAEKTASTAIATCIVVGIGLSVLGNIFIVPLLDAFGATATILPFAVDYGRILITFSIFQVINMCVNNMVRAEGSAKMSMIAITVGAVLNIILDPIFIFVFGLGIKGAAIATIISQAISTILLLRFYLSGKSMMKLSFKKITLKISMYIEIMKIGVPTFLRQVLVSLSMALINVAAEPYGDSAIAAIGIIMRSFMLSFFVLFGLNQGTMPIAGYSFGAGNFIRVKEVIKTVLKVSTIFCIIMTIIFVVFAPYIASVFSKDPTVINIATRGLRVYSILLPFGGFMICYTGIFQSLGKAKQSAVLSISRQGLFLIPSVLILPIFFQFDGILFSQVSADFLTILTTLFMVISLRKEIDKGIKEQERNELINS